MKKFLSFIFVLTIVLATVGCGNEAPEKTAEDMDLSDLGTAVSNYNDYFDSYDEFCAVGDVCFFTTYTMFDSYLSVYRDGAVAQLVKESDFEDKYIEIDYYVIGGYLYFSLYSYDTENAVTDIYRYGFADKTYEAVCSVDDISYWMPTADKIAYMKLYDGDGSIDSLYVYDIASDTHTLVAKEIEQFGIVGDSIRYVQYTDKFNVCDYNVNTGESVTLGEYSDFSIKDTIFYNFTADAVVLMSYAANENSADSEIAVYTIGGDVKKYTVPGMVMQLCAADDYAYMIMCRESEKSGLSAFIDGYEYTVYRVSLKTGEYEALDIEADDSTSLYVESDNVLYVLGGNLSPFSSDKNKVTKYDFEGGTSEFLFSYKAYV